ncbi:MAG: hypothetical protein CL674_14905 [Bdellovibrionaceae bacterium]|nr:hypothetical protein [Pseudobdellovibrionaceae bacterium]|tara:strand:- start:37724 stop:38428 length:705 start_codon:yes stop_codon:yes gene_type:complete
MWCYFILFFFISTFCFSAVEENLSLRYFPNSINYSLKGKYNVTDEPNNINSAFQFINHIQTNAWIESGGTVGLELIYSPIPIIELLTASTYTYRYYELHPLDCDLVQCEGLIKQDILSLSIQAKLAGFFLRLTETREWFELKNDKDNFMIVDGPLYGEGEKDILTKYTGVLGYEFSKDYSLLVLYRYGRVKKTDLNYEFYYLVYQFLKDYRFGLGFHQSSLGERSPSAIFSIDF